MDATHNQEYRIRDLPTRSITLFPTRAQVVRDIKDVVLKPGLNQISVVGLTPTVDEHSIKVEGTGSAIITDISVELLDNSDIFQEIYPDSDSDDNDVAADEGSEDAQAKDFDKEAYDRARTEIKEVKAKIVALLDDIKRADEVVFSAEKRLTMLDEYGKKFEPKSGADVGEIVDIYTDQRGKTFEDHIKGTIRQRELNEELARLREAQRNSDAEMRKEDNKRIKASQKQQEARRKKEQLAAARRQKKAAEKMRIRNEKQKFWPRSCYTVRITLDATHYTPISSRRSSISSVTDLVKPVLENPTDPTSSSPESPSSACDISVSYVTCAAFWSPSYDLQLNTTNNTGTLFFDAQLTNNTSEAWKDCKIILSTSQAVFSGLQDDIPKLVPWRIKLAGKYIGYLGDITNSSHEVEHRKKSQKASASVFQEKPGASLIGLRSGPFMQHARHNEMAMCSVPAPPAQAGGLFGAPPQQMQQQMQPQQRNTTSGGLFGSTNAAATSSVFGQPNRGSGGALFGSSLGGASFRQYASANLNAPASGQDLAFDRDLAEEQLTLHEPEPEPLLSFQESAIEETGLTTTYDLPGTKTLIPSTNASKQRVARILFTNVTFSHTIVAKYRPAAFLKANLRNASKMSLLKGPVGLTLDGTFMGRSTLPRCSSGDSFNMSLGIDPAIKVVYPKPDVKRSTSGVFTKENSTAYARSIAITNTRGGSSSPSAGANKAVRLVVLDQVPVSEDDKLRVEILQPRGLSEGGSGVGAGVQESGAKEGKDWGKAVAKLKKGGEVSWDVELNAGKSVKLSLEYDVSLPAGDQAVQAQETSGR
ncbi:hypothetical protein Daus18300_008357 [Diaporthe australafricana]|uniref:Mucoidy inhibitor-like protein n=1 Tax=Diaporthe australafricana TaxID=127596 RepID=A0ABR3WJK5_9PEZI